MVVFWGSFGGEETNTKNQIIYTNQYVYILDNFEDTLWICVVLKNFTEETVYYPSEGRNYQSVANDVYRVEKPVLSRENGLQFVKHFVNSFSLFYGKVSTYMTEQQRLSEDFAFIFEKFMLHYKKLNSVNFPRLNMLKYLDTYINYAPVEKKVFMAIHYLLNVIRHIDTNIAQQIVFYNGYFIFSTFNLKVSQLFYDYFYLGGDTTAIETNKIFTKFSPIQSNQRFDPRLKYGYRLDINNNNKGFLTGFIDNSETRSRLLVEPIEETQPESLDDEFIPTVHLHMFDYAAKYRMMTYYDSGLLVLLFYNNRDDINLTKVNEVQFAISKNIAKLSNNLDKQIKRIHAQEDTSRLLYENHCNYALRISKPFLKSMEPNIFRMVANMKERFDQDQSNRSIIAKCHGFWIYGRIFNQRRVFMLLNGANNLVKAEEEKEDLIKNNFSNILY